MTDRGDLQSREDIDRLLVAFYAAVRNDERLGPVFEAAIEEARWPEHLAHIGDFWETMLFQVPKYSGAPIPAHIRLDKTMPLDAGHFERWLGLFGTTVDRLFRGGVTDEAKKRAQLMAPLMLYKIEAARRPGFLR